MITFKNFIELTNEGIEQDAMKKAISFIGSSRIHIVDKSLANEVLEKGKILKQETIKTIGDGVSIALIKYNNIEYVQIATGAKSTVYKKS